MTTPTPNGIASATQLMAQVLDYLKGASSLDDLCGYVGTIIDAYERRYADDTSTDLSADLAWFCSSEIHGLCSRRARWGLDEMRVRSVLEAWLPHLKDGEQAWRDAVNRGEWPISWEESDDDGGKSPG